MPVALRGGLVVVETEVDAKRNLLHRIDELQVRRRGVDRVAAEDDQQAHGAGVHLADQFLQRRALVDRTGFGGLRVGDRGADVAERVVHRVRERVNRRRLTVAGDDQAAARARPADP